VLLRGRKGKKRRREKRRLRARDEKSTSSSLSRRTHKPLCLFLTPGRRIEKKRAICRLGTERPTGKGGSFPIASPCGERATELCILLKELPKKTGAGKGRRNPRRADDFAPEEKKARPVLFFERSPGKNCCTKRKRWRRRSSARRQKRREFLSRGGEGQLSFLPRTERAEGEKKSGA